MKRKHRMQRRGSAIPWASSVVACFMGCVAPAPISVERHPIAVLYSVEWLSDGTESDELVRRVRADVSRARELGFDAVVLDHVEEDDRGQLVSIGADGGLCVLSSDRAIDRYVSTGLRPAGIENAEGLVRNFHRRRSPWNECGLYLGRVPMTEAAHERVKEVVRAAASQRVVVFRTSNCEGGISGAACAAYVDAGALATDGDHSPLEGMLSQYHAALAAGGTNGLVVDRFARPPGDPPGASAADGPSSEAKRAALQGLIRRARVWGRLLSGMDGEGLEVAEHRETGVLFTAFSGSRRRYVMAFNASSDRYYRGSAMLPATIGGRPVDRLVEVPSTPDRTAGKVYPARRTGGVTVELELRPGDAALFEVF